VLLERHLARVVTGNVNASATLTWGVLAALTVLVWWLSRRHGPEEQRHLFRVSMFFGPVWWIIGVIPIAVAGYESPRHVYLASAGWAIVLGVVFNLAWTSVSSALARRVVVGAAAAIVIVYSIGLYHEVLMWNTLARVSRKVILDTRAEAMKAAPGSLIVIGAPKLSWEWAMPFPMKPPYTRVDLTSRVFMVSPWLLHCCRNQWVDDTRRTLQAWQRRDPHAPVIVLRWDGDTGALSRITDREYPALKSLVPVLLEVRTRDELAAAVLKIVDDLPVPTGR
jgi:heme/copper-type cytochrome/quinol oxidase subunit 2